MVIGRFTDSHFTDTENLVDGVDNAGHQLFKGYIIAQTKHYIL